jgi:hypothetical protein
MAELNSTKKTETGSGQVPPAGAVKIANVAELNRLAAQGLDESGIWRDPNSNDIYRLGVSSTQNVVPGNSIGSSPANASDVNDMAGAKSFINSQQDSDISTSEKGNEPPLRGSAKVMEDIRDTITGGQVIAYIQSGDSREALSKLAKEGKYKFNMAFLDIPYKTAGVTGGNRGIDFDTVSPDDFAKDIVGPLKEMMVDGDSPIVYMYSQSKTGQKDMAKYTDKLAEAGLKVVAKGTYTKTYKSGKPMKFGKYLMPPEEVLILNQSGNNVTSLTDGFDVREVAPLYRGHYQTEKAPGLLKALIEGTTKVGDTIIDPFAGSGVSLEQAIKAYRNVYGIELSEEAVEKRIKPRVKKAVADTKKKPNGKKVKASFGVDENGDVVFDRNDDGSIRVVNMSKGELKEAGFGIEAAGFGDSADVFYLGGKPAIATHYIDEGLDGFSVSKKFRGTGLSDAFLGSLFKNGYFDVVDPNEKMLRTLGRVGDVGEVGGSGIVSVIGKDFDRSTIGGLVKYLKLKYSDLDLSVTEKHGDIVLHKISIYRALRNKGIGTAAMKALTEYADKKGYRILLTPTKDFGGSVPRLKTFYSRFGFVENKGDNKDASTKETMIRNPKKKSIASLPGNLRPMIICGLTGLVISRRSS